MDNQHFPKFLVHFLAFIFFFQNHHKLSETASILAVLILHNIAELELDSTVVLAGVFGGE